MTGDLKTRLAEWIQNEIAPAVEIDGAGIEVVNVAEGIAQIRFTGACAGCPSTTMTLIMALEQEIRRHFPEVQFLEAIP